LTNLHYRSVAGGFTLHLINSWLTDGVKYSPLIGLLHHLSFVDSDNGIGYGFVGVVYYSYLNPIVYLSGELHKLGEK